MGQIDTPPSTHFLAPGIKFLFIKNYYKSTKTVINNP